MHLSLNEIEAQIRKAARGAGLAWGHAEEAGRAVRWLLAHDIAVLPAAAALIEAHADGSITAALHADRHAWRNRDGRLSPLIFGPALSDRASAIAAGEPIVGHDVAFPILLAGFVANAVRLARVPLALAWSGGSLAFSADGSPRRAPGSLVALQSCERIVCGVAEETASAIAEPPTWEGVAVDPALWARFDRLAAATYVPASAASRERGAGAGAIDND